MNSLSDTPGAQSLETVAVEWSESEWFNIWLKLARGESPAPNAGAEAHAEPQPVAA
jgi:hypothetical protein